MLVQQEKITITIPSSMKDEIVKMKDELKISMNNIYQTAIAEYVKQRKREKLRKEAESMVSYYDSNSEALELLEEAGDIYEY